MPQLRVIEGENKNNCFMLSSSHVVIGRVDGDIVIADSQVSSRHAQIKQTIEGWYIEDTGSRNGTFVNEIRVTQSILLKPDDRIRVGITVLVFEEKNIKVKSGNSLRISQLLDGIPRVIGRAPDSDIQINEAVVSRHHARLCCENKQIVLTDLNSSNGTFVNGQKIRRIVLHSGDRIRIGATEYTICEDALSLIGVKDAIRLDVRGVSHAVTFRGEMRQLLDNVDFSVKPGEFVAVVGGSGTGKTSLFRIMTGLENPTIGSVLLNGIDYHTQSHQFAGQVGFVPQDDIVHNELTVRTALHFAAKLRLPPDTTNFECDQRVMAVLEAVKLIHRIDSDIKLLSGGERKRVNVALELLTEPNLIFLDEPTSGLDPHREKQMMELMRQLAGEGRTILLTTHSTLSLDMCDLLLIMGAGGHVVYFGPPRQALTHFKVTEYHDIYAQLGETASEVIIHKHTYWRSHICKQYGGIREGYIKPFVQAYSTQSGNTFDAIGWFRQFILLSQRYFVILSKDYLNLTVLLAQAPILVLIILLVFPSNCFDAVMDSNGKSPFSYAKPVTFLLSIIAIWFGTSNSIREIVKEVPINIRERLAFLRPSAYLCSKFVVLAGLCLLQCVILVVGIGYRMSWFCVDNNAVWSLLGVLFLTSLAGLSLGLTLSCITKSSDQAVSLTPLVLVPQIVFSGLFLPDNAGYFVLMLAKIHISYWSFGALGNIIDINGKMKSLLGPSFVESKCFTGEAEYKIMALWILFTVLTCIALAVVQIKRKR